MDCYLLMRKMKETFPRQPKFSLDNREKENMYTLITPTRCDQTSPRLCLPLLLSSRIDVVAMVDGGLIGFVLKNVSLAPSVNFL